MSGINYSTGDIQFKSGLHGIGPVTGKVLAGKHNVQRPVENTAKFVSDAVASLKQAKWSKNKNEHMLVRHKLPWEFEHKNFFASETERIETKLKIVEEILPKVNKINVAQAEIMKIKGNLVLELATAAKENEFRRDFRAWMLGERPLEEYMDDKREVRCLWYKQTNKTTAANYDSALRKNSNHNQFETDEMLNERAARSLIDKVPALAEGWIREEDEIKLRGELALRALALKTPETDMEAYLYYKYIVRKHPLSYEYIYSEQYVQEMKEFTAEKGERPVKKPDIVEMSETDVFENQEPAPKRTRDSENLGSVTPKDLEDAVEGYRNVASDIINSQIEIQTAVHQQTEINKQKIADLASYIELLKTRIQNYVNDNEEVNAHSKSNIAGLRRSAKEIEDRLAGLEATAQLKKDRKALKMAAAQIDNVNGIIDELDAGKEEEGADNGDTGTREQRVPSAVQSLKEKTEKLATVTRKRFDPPIPIEKSKNEISEQKSADAPVPKNKQHSDSVRVYSDITVPARKTRFAGPVATTGKLDNKDGVTALEKQSGEEKVAKTTDVNTGPRKRFDPPIPIEKSKNEISEQKSADAPVPKNKQHSDSVRVYSDITVPARKTRFAGPVATTGKLDNKDGVTALEKQSGEEKVAKTTDVNTGPRKRFGAPIPIEKTAVNAAKAIEKNTTDRIGQQLDAAPDNSSISDLYSNPNAPETAIAIDATIQQAENGDTLARSLLQVAGVATGEAINMVKENGAVVAQRGQEMINQFVREASGGYAAVRSEGEAVTEEDVRNALPGLSSEQQAQVYEEIRARWNERGRNFGNGLITGAADLAGLAISGTVGNVAGQLATAAGAINSAYHAAAGTVGLANTISQATGLTPENGLNLSVLLLGKTLFVGGGALALGANAVAATSRVATSTALVVRDNYQPVTNGALGLVTGLFSGGYNAVASIATRQLFQRAANFANARLDGEDANAYMIRLMHELIRNTARNNRTARSDNNNTIVVPSNGRIQEMSADSINNLSALVATNVISVEMAVMLESQIGIPRDVGRTRTQVTDQQLVIARNRLRGVSNNVEDTLERLGLPRSIIQHATHFAELNVHRENTETALRSYVTGMTARGYVVSDEWGSATRMLTWMAFLNAKNVADAHLLATQRTTQEELDADDSTRRKMEANMDRLLSDNSPDPKDLALAIKKYVSASYADPSGLTKYIANERFDNMASELVSRMDAAEQRRFPNILGGLGVLLSSRQHIGNRMYFTNAEALRFDLSSDARDENAIEYNVEREEESVEDNAAVSDFYIYSIKLGPQDVHRTYLQDVADYNIHKTVALTASPEERFDMRVRQVLTFFFAGLNRSKSDESFPKPGDLAGVYLHDFLKIPPSTDINRYTLHPRMHPSIITLLNLALREGDTMPIIQNFNVLSRIVRHGQNKLNFTVPSGQSISPYMNYSRGSLEAERRMFDTCMHYLESEETLTPKYYLQNNNFSKARSKIVPGKK